MANMAELDADSRQQMQSMEKMYRNAAKGVPEFPLLINVPRKQLITKLMIYWVSLFFTALFSFSFFWMITGIAFAVLVHKLYLFSSVWKAYSYSKLILWVPCIFIFFLGMSITTRLFLLGVFRYIFKM